MDNAMLSIIAEKACHLYGYRNDGNNATQSGNELFLGSDYIATIRGDEIHFDRNGFFPSVATLSDLERG